MTLQKISAGKRIPEDIYIIVEIPAKSDPVKYEVDKESGSLFVDRFMPTAMFYPCNYGYINNTLSLDNDPVDVMICTPYPIRSGSIIRGRPVGLLEMEDESGEDAKVIAVPHESVTKDYEYVKNIYDLSESLLAQIVHFFENYKKLEKGKWVKVRGWKGVETAHSEIISAFERAQAKT